MAAILKEEWHVFTIQIYGLEDSLECYQTNMNIPINEVLHFGLENGDGGTYFDKKKKITMVPASELPKNEDDQMWMYKVNVDSYATVCLRNAAVALLKRTLSRVHQVSKNRPEVKTYIIIDDDIELD